MAPTPPTIDRPPPRRHALVATTRFVAPVAAALGIAGLLLSVGALMRSLYGLLTLGVLAMWLVTRLRRPEVVVDDDGYQVEVRGRPLVRVRFDEIKRVRAVPAQQAMYLDCGEPARNLLLPPRTGWGYRFERQRELYDYLSLRLADRIEIVDELVRPEPRGTRPPSSGNGVKNGHNPPRDES